MRFSKLCILFLLPASLSWLAAAPFGLDFIGRKAERVQEQKVEKKLWSKPEASRLQDKTFPITEWNKHFSSLGSKRAPIALDEKKKKERFEIDVMERKTIDFDMSRWNDRMADLHKQAGIDMDKRAQLVADRELYDMMLQDARNYREIAEKLSLRDINRFQFRRNRSPDGIPIKKAGEGTN